MNSRSKLLAILTGAGISAESGIPTFRDKNGLWENHRVEEVACPTAFNNNPQLVQQFYNQRRNALLSPHVNYNSAHSALAKLQREYKEGKVIIITQNIDDLQERAGALSVFHMHGELLKMRCINSGEIFLCREDIIHGKSKCKCCNKVETLRPHIVWFGEMPFYMEEISEIINQANIFVAIGTSGNVYPAAGFVTQAKLNGAKTIELNLEPGDNQSAFDESIYGKASEIVPAWVEKMLKSNV